MKNMTISLLALSVLAFGCKNKDCEDSAEDCDSGAEAAPDPEPEPDVQDSCELAAGICVETDESDNAAWCASENGTYDAANGCDTTDAVICDIPTGGAYSAPAVAYYTGSFGADTCTASGGTVRE